MTTKGGRLQTTVPVIPDAPIGHFSLTTFGGKRGYLANTRNLCEHAPAIGIKFAGQNGKPESQNLKVKMDCGGAARHKVGRSRRVRLDIPCTMIYTPISLCKLRYF